MKWTRNRGETAYYAYNLMGQLTHQWGSGAYPVKHGYNGFGDRVTLTTYRSSSGSTAVPAVCAGGVPLPALFNNNAAAFERTRPGWRQLPTGKDDS